MRNHQVDEVLEQTVADRRLSRGERQALAEVLGGEDAGPDRLDYIRHRAFALARKRLHAGPEREVVEWLEDLVKALVAAERGQDVGGELAEAHFSPGPDCQRRIVGLLRGARRTVDVCVFTVTDDTISDEVLAAHRRGVRLRLVTDDDKSYDRGSDIDRLVRAGVPVRWDNSDHHMHHKFAIFDRSVLLTGSYNWTRSAAKYNQENIVVSDDARLLKKFSSIFSNLWTIFAPRRGG